MCAGAGAILWRGQAATERHRQQARAALERGDWREVERVARLLEQSAGPDEGLVIRGEAYLRRGRVAMDELAHVTAALDGAGRVGLLLDAAALVGQPHGRASALPKGRGGGKNQGQPEHQTRIGHANLPNS